MSGVAPEKSGHIIRPYDYKCHRCGWQGERRVQLAKRDHQTCHKCGDWMERLSHFGTVGVKIPLYMRSTANEMQVLPDTKVGVGKFLDTAHKNGYRRRTDIV